MNNFNRCMNTIKLQKTDYRAAALHNFQVCAKYSQESYAQFVLNPEQMADMHEEMQQRFGYDMLMVENGTASLAESLGCGVVYRDDDSPVAHSPALNDLMEVSSLEVSEAILESPLVKANIETVKILRKRLGDSVVILGRGDQGPFSLASQLYGMNNLLVDLLSEDAEAEIHLLLKKCVEANIIYCKALLEAGAHVTSLGDSTAGPDVISPMMYETYAKPYEQEVVEAIHNIGGLISLHICGNATSIIDKMVQTGADILEIDQKSDVLGAIKAAQGNCALLGQVSPITLMRGSVEQVRSETKALIDIANQQDYNGLILGAGCALGGSTPFTNIEEMLSFR